MSAARLLDYWSPPDGAGTPVACLCTSFTFESDFFDQDCLSRFLSLSTVSDEGDDKISSIVAVLEEEDRLSEAQVSVLVDRSSPAEKRNLRWDVLPVSVSGGLLHAKLAVLLWERTARIILGSANLTSAGYRRQIELAVAIDLDAECAVTETVLNDFVAEVRGLVQLVPGPSTGAKRRALDTVNLLEARVASLGLPRTARSDLRLAVAPARPGVNPLDRLPDVWRGSQPLRATVLSPFWDDRVPAPAIEAVRRHLTGRPTHRRKITLVTAVDPFTGTVQATPSLSSQGGAEVVAFEPPDAERRTLHAKLLLMETDDWLAALIGSSNTTKAGYGLDAHSGHHELNLWVGCPADSPSAKHLRSLARPGEQIDLSDDQWEPMPDEDEPTTPVLPLGFVTCNIDARKPARALLDVDVKGLPQSWRVMTPAGSELLTAEQWQAGGSPRENAVELPEEILPAYLLVHWYADNERCEATWTANVEDRSALPPPAELAQLPVEVLLAALASTRPLPVALEQELRRRERAKLDDYRVELDPLRRFDDSGMLLQRTRQLSLALWRLQDRLDRPAGSLDALHWRLHGAFGPVAIAEGLVRAAQAKETIPGEAHFLLAELALTIAAVDWTRVTAGLDSTAALNLVSEVLTQIENRCSHLPPAPDPALSSYARDALEEARR